MLQEHSIFSDIKDLCIVGEFCLKWKV